MKQILFTIGASILALITFLFGLKFRKRPKKDDLKTVIDENEKIIKENRDFLNRAKPRDLM